MSELQLNSKQTQKESGRSRHVRSCHHTGHCYHPSETERSTYANQEEGGNSEPQTFEC